MLEAAGTLNSYVFLAAVFLTPAFGLLVDRIQRYGLLLTLGALGLPLSFLILDSQGTDGLSVATILLRQLFARAGGAMVGGRPLLRSRAARHSVLAHDRTLACGPSWRNEIRISFANDRTIGPARSIGGAQKQRHLAVE